MIKSKVASLKKEYHYPTLRMIVIFVIFFLLGAYITPVSSYEFSDFTEGQFLYAPMWSTTTYLRNSDGSLNHSWTSSFIPGAAVWWPGDGTLIRSIRDGGVDPGTGGAGGGVQKVAWDGTILWDFRYNTGGKLSHHDVKTLPNGNVLLIAWESKTRAEAIAAGRNPNYVLSSGLLPDHIVEIKQTGLNEGEIVWAWHVWDHLIQDYNSSAENYGIVADHPELVNINYIVDSNVDLMHSNSIDYNEQFNQIMISVHNYNEIWVIDHSTTIEEAAGHTGGNSGRGGDLLYRWGNPMTYNTGTINDRKFFGQHDATWINEGCPGEGNILVFNNGVNRPGTDYSTVEEIIPPVNENGAYYLETGCAYGPETQSWIYTADPPTSLYSTAGCGAQRLSNGNTLICETDSGRIFEVTPEGITVWQYNTGSQPFKVVYIPPGGIEPPQNDTIPDLESTGSLSWDDIKPGATVTGHFTVQNVGDSDSLLNWTINTSSVSWGTWSFTPTSGDNLTPEQGSKTVLVSVVAPDQPNTKFQGYVRVENINDPADFELIPVTLKTPVKIVPPLLAYLYQLLSYFLNNHPLLEKLYDIL